MAIDFDKIVERKLARELDPNSMEAISMAYAVGSVLPEALAKLQTAAKAAGDMDEMQTKLADAETKLKAAQAAGTSTKAAAAAVRYWEAQIDSAADLSEMASAVNARVKAGLK